MARVAFIVDEMFEDSELQVPYDRVKEAGHEAVVVGMKRGKELSGKRGRVAVTVEVASNEVSAEDFDALVIPGGYSPDKIRMDENLVALTRRINEQRKPIAAICHAGWMLVEAGIVRGRTVTSYPSIKTDLKNAGADWVDQEVVEDQNLITSRWPDDLDAFCKALLSQMEGVS